MDLLDSFLCDIYRYEFMEMRNSSLLRVCCILLWMVFIASIGFMSEMNLRRIHIRSRVVLSCKRSSRRVEEATRLTAGKIRLLLSERSSCNSMLPVPLNYSKMTSSILLPVSIRAVAMMVSEPPFSILRAAPKKRLGFCNALASTPPVNTLPDAGATVL